MPPLPSRPVISCESSVPMGKTIISYGIIEHGRLVGRKTRARKCAEENESWPTRLIPENAAAMIFPFTITEGGGCSRSPLGDGDSSALREPVFFSQDQTYRVHRYDKEL